MWTTFASNRMRIIYLFTIENKNDSIILNNSVTPVDTACITEITENNICGNRTIEVNVKTKTTTPNNTWNVWYTANINFIIIITGIITSFTTVYTASVMVVLTILLLRSIRHYGGKVFQGTQTFTLHCTGFFQSHLFAVFQTITDYMHSFCVLHFSVSQALFSSGYAFEVSGNRVSRSNILSNTAAGLCWQVSFYDSKWRVLSSSSKNICYLFWVNKNNIRCYLTEDIHYFKLLRWRERW